MPKVTLSSVTVIVTITSNTILVFPVLSQTAELAVMHRLKSSEDWRRQRTVVL